VFERLLTIIRRSILQTFNSVARLMHGQRHQFPNNEQLLCVTCLTVLLRKCIPTATKRQTKMIYTRSMAWRRRRIARNISRQF